MLLTSIVCLFLVQFSVERKYSDTHSLSMPEVPATPPSANEEETLPRHNIRYSLQIINQSYPLPIERSLSEPALTNHNNDDKTTTTPSLESLPNRDLASNPSYREQIATFQVLFHSGIIGLNLGTSSSTQLKSLFIVLVFHQAFEGFSLGARLSAITFPPKNAG
ncbi:hypothetical protein NA56DRAFT_743119 [Hyaloscypha hepaticicola]|uniref:Zinc/iron permease n=1 Tax=Hyaloscypha hepaticicola TaxID=2082293 RepID=A0A2J6QNF9_9HELO|nr:hypothetical protein NA56DRAFT_743119 [Hyaloscypha hepaticicola]